MEIKEILKKVDHTLLKPEADWPQIKTLCDEGIRYGVASVCIPPRFVRQAKEYVGNSLKICTVAGFPNGYNSSEVKAFETKSALADGADEIDMVACISAIKNGNYAHVRREIKQIVKAAKGSPVKVILETSLLTRDEMVRAALCARDAGAAFVKTSTGYFGEGAKAEDVKLLKQTVDGKCSVKASGGIRTAEKFREMIEAGADRIGTSAGKDIAETLQREMK